jgi:hypothetical protein
MNADTNITGILRSLMRELDKVKTEIARINKTNGKGTQTMGVNKTGNESCQASTAKSPPPPSSISSKDTSFAAIATVGNLKDRL